MSEVAVLKAAAEKLLADLDQRVVAAAKGLGVKVEDLLVKVDHTQLRVAVHRLELFAEHVERVIIDFDVIPAPASAEAEGEQESESETVPTGKLEDLSRDDLNDIAAELGIDSPDKLKNKPAVIEAIRAVRAEAESEPES